MNSGRRILQLGRNVLRQQVSRRTESTLGGIFSEEKEKLKEMYKPNKKGIYIAYALVLGANAYVAGQLARYIWLTLPLDEEYDGDLVSYVKPPSSKE